MGSPDRLFVRALLLGALLGGCDTIEARQKASEAATDYKKGLLRKAAEKYEASATLDPGIAVVQLNLGFTYLSLLTEEPSSSPQRQAYGQKAIEHFRRYIELNPSDPRGRNFLVQAFVDSKRYDDAKAYFKDEIEKDPPSLEIITIMSEIAAKLGKLDDALALCEKRAALKPDDPDAHLALGVLVWDHLHRHPEIRGTERLELADRGIKALEHAIELRPNAPDPLTFINLVYRQRALGHPCETFDGGLGEAQPQPRRRRASDVPDAGPDAGTLEECEALRKADLDLANDFYKKARELQKQQADAGTATTKGK